MRLLFGIGLALAAPGWAYGQAAVVECLKERIEIEAIMGAMTPLPTAEITITNGLPYAISSIHYSMVISESGRSVPWLETDTGLNIPGGVEPGETRVLHAFTGSISQDAGDLLDVDIQIIDVADADKLSISGVSRFHD